MTSPGTYLLALLTMLPAVSAGSAAAQTTYPDRPIRIIVGFAAAGPADLTARVIGEKFTDAWGQPVVIENVTGAGANIAGDRVAKAAPDGYTLLLASLAQLTINPALYDKMPYDTVKDVAPITQAVFTPNILAVNNDVPAKSVAELVALARAQPQPGKLTFGSAGVGTSQHLAGELFKSKAHVDMQHVPYRGAAPVITDLLGGRISMFFGNVTAVLPQVQDGKLRGLAVTSLKRIAAAPDLPTLAESGFPGFDATASFGLVAPAGTPPAIIDKLHRETVRILALPDVRKRFAELGSEVIGNSPAEFSAVIKAEIPQWAKLIKEAGIRGSD
jgi:tripartite-type tricarboxylate transporter receptor subunit TctC